MKFKQVIWLPFVVFAIPLDWAKWNWIMPAKGFRPITLKEAWNDSWETWRNL